MSILSKIFGLFTSAASKNGVTMMKDGKALTEEQVAAMGETADLHEALSDTFAATADTQTKAIASLESRMKAYEEKAASQDTQAKTITDLQAKIAQMEAEAKATNDKLVASQAQITTLAQEHNKGKTTPIVSTPVTPDDSNKMVEKSEVEAAINGYQDTKLAAEMTANMKRAQAAKKIFPTT